MLNESQQKPKRRRQHSTHKKKTGWKRNAVQIEIEKGKEENKFEDKSTSATRERKKRRQHARGIRLLQARKERGGGVAPRRNNRTTESATKGKQGSESKSEEGDTIIKRKTTRRKDKRTKKEQGMGHGERQKGERKNEERKEKKRKEKKRKGKEEENGKGVRALLCYNYIRAWHGCRRCRHSLAPMLRTGKYTCVVYLVSSLPWY